MQQKIVPEAVKGLVHRIHKKTRSRSRSTTASSSCSSLDVDLSSDYYKICPQDLPTYRHSSRRDDSVSPRSSCRRSIESTTESTESAESTATTCSSSSRQEAPRRGRSSVQVPLATLTSKPLVPPPVPPKDILLPSELDAEIHVAHRRTLSRSPVRSDSHCRRHAIYFQSMQPQYDPASKMLFFHDPSAAALTQL